jgi:hypothetical protein
MSRPRAITIKDVSPETIEAKIIEDLYAIKYFLEHVLSGGLEKEDSE